jgi:enediyne biosynthesis protein E4
VDHGWTLAVAACDLTDNLLPDLYFANDFGPDRLLYNESTPGHLRFKLVKGQSDATTPSSKVLGRDSFKGMGVDCGDLNGDGVPDIIVSNITEEYALQESNFVFLHTGDPGHMQSLMQNGIAPYVDRSEQLGLSRSGWAWDVKMDDFINSGSLQVLQATGFIRGKTNRWPELQELAIGNDALLSDPRFWPQFKPGDDLSGSDHDRFYVRDKNGRYVDVGARVGLGEPMVSRGMAIADVYGNGRLDFAVANQWGPSYFYRNDCTACGASLSLHLLLPLRADSPATTRIGGHSAADAPGRPAIGAAATVFFPDGRRLVAQVDGGNGHSGRRSFDLHFGLGRLPLRMHLRVDVHWRDPAGRVHRQTVYLAPGWHTLVLGWPGRKGH